jgi:hypothetical protein
MQRQIDRQQERIESLESAEYNRVNILFLTDGVTAPGTVSGWGQMYIDTSDGDLKIRFGDGQVKTIVTDT